MQLPIKAMTDEYKTAKCRAVMMLRDNQAQKIREAGITVRTGRKWKQNKQ